MDGKNSSISSSLLNDSGGAGASDSLALTKKPRAAKTNKNGVKRSTGKSAGGSSGACTFDKAIRDLVVRYFKLKLIDVEVEFLADFFSELPDLNETWDRIGFDAENKTSRLEVFYDKLRVS